MSSHTSLSASEAETAQVGQELAAAAVSGDVVLLIGPIASGKSVLARAFLRARGVRVPVPSPTYTLVNEYWVDDCRYLHVDAYRLGSLAEYVDLGILDEEDGAITLVEWGEKVADLYQHATLVRLEVDAADDQKRRITVARIGAGVTR